MSDRFSQVESFAELMAGLDDPFAERGAVLDAAELDEARLQRLLGSWRARLGGDGAAELAERFSEAYASRRAMLVERRRHGVTAEAQVLPALSHPGTPPSAATAGLAPPSARAAASPSAEPRAQSPGSRLLPPRPPRYLVSTEELGTVVPRAALPFHPAATRGGSPPAPAGGRKAPLHVSTGTADLGDLVARPLVSLPFEKAPSPRSDTPVPARAPSPQVTAPAEEPPLEPGPRRRLIRFDPQTGQPLPVPIWVDIPAEPTR